jgi:hypothetical protein
VVRKTFPSMGRITPVFASKNVALPRAAAILSATEIRTVGVKNGGGGDENEARAAGRS